MPDKDCQLTKRTSGEILVWDAEGVPDADAQITVLWRNFEAIPERGNRVVSIPRLVEETADELRGRYLAWVYALGEAMVHGKSIAEHLLIRQGLSYWWMASPAQKFVFSAKSLVPDAIKMLALEKLLAGEQAQTLVLHSSNIRLAECLTAYCGKTGFRFHWRRTEQPKCVDTPIRAAYQKLPPLLRALLSLGKFCVARIPSAIGRQGCYINLGNISFFDVLVHLDERALSSGSFMSNYWGPLVEKLGVRGVRVNWFHMFYTHPAVRTFFRASSLIQRFQKSTLDRQVHALIDALPSVVTVVKAWRDYMFLQNAKQVIGRVFDNLQPEDSILNLWVFHEEEWVESTSGPSALIECLRLGLFEAAISRLPQQKVGVYISENQPWELSLIYSWRNYGHGRLVAAHHSTTRFWDLRYFFDPRIYGKTGPSGMPSPDYYAVNGPAAKETVLNSGYPGKKVIEVEALRFFYLRHIAPEADLQNGLKRLLVCGDFLSRTNDRIFSLLAHSEKQFPTGSTVVFKPHPAFPYVPNVELVSNFSLLIDERPLNELLSECDVVITSAVTSAAVDAYCAGKRVVQILDGKGLNASALRGLDGVRMVSSSDELADALRSDWCRQPARETSYFNLDPTLQDWIDVLEVGGGSNC